MSNLVIPRRGIWTQQPQGPTSTQEVFGYQVGEVVCPTVALHKISGGIGVAARASGLAFIGDSVDNCASRSLTRPFVLGKDTELTFVCVFRRQGTAQTGNAIAGMGATGGGSGNTLFRITGGDTAANIKFQVQGSNGSIIYNVNSSGVTVNDRGTHTAVIALSLSVGTGTLEFVIDGKPAGSAAIAAGTPSATTFNSVTACASIRGGAVIGAGDADVTLAYPIFGKVSQAQAISLSLNPWQIFAPQSRQLFVPVSAGGPTTVTIESTAAYKIQGSVQSGSTANYALRASVQNDAVNEYSIRGSIQQSATPAYLIRGLVDQVITAIYGIRTSVSSDASATYNILSASSVSASASAGYNIRGGINQDAASSYALRGSVTQSSSAAYNILSASSVTASITAGYVIKGSVQSNIVAGYSIAQSVHAEIAANYIIRAGAVSEAQAAYVIRGLVQQSIAASYVIDGEQPSSGSLAVMVNGHYSSVGNVLVRNGTYKAVTVFAKLNGHYSPVTP